MHDKTFARVQRLQRGLRPHFAACPPEVHGPRFLHLFLYGVASGVFVEPASGAIISAGVVCRAFYHLEELSSSFGTLLATSLIQVFLFSFMAVPSSSAFWEIFFHVLRDFELFHWSLELCPASSTEDGRRWDLDFQSFDDHPACLCVMARFNTAMFF